MANWGASQLWVISRPFAPAQSTVPIVMDYYEPEDSVYEDTEEWWQEDIETDPFNVEYELVRLFRRNCWRALCLSSSHFLVNFLKERIYMALDI